MNQAQFDTIAHTLLQVFPNTLVINGDTASKTPMIGLCGWQNDQTWETQELVNKIQEIRKQKGISDILSLNAQLLIVGTLNKSAFTSAPINTLDNALLEIDAGKFWITKDLRPNRSPDNLETVFLSGANWKIFTIQLQENTNPVLDPIHRKQYVDALK